MTLLMVALAVLVVLLLFGWRRRGARTTSNFTLVDDGGVRLREADPGRLYAKRGESVRWVVGNQTGKPIDVAMTGFRNAETDRPSRVFGEDTGGRIPPGGGTIEATVLADADPGRHFYVIELVPGRPHNTPEIMIRE